MGFPADISLSCSSLLYLYVGLERLEQCYDSDFICVLSLIIGWEYFGSRGKIVTIECGVKI